MSSLFFIGISESQIHILIVLINLLKLHREKIARNSGDLQVISSETLLLLKITAHILYIAMETAKAELAKQWIAMVVNILEIASDIAFEIDASKLVLIGNFIHVLYFNCS